jgi:TonB family protein
MSDHLQAEKPLAIGERRLHTRTPVTPQAFVKFGANNYGFVFNISENGLVFAPTGTLTLTVGAVAKMRFQLPDSKEWIETSGEVAWIAESQKEAGVRFVDLMEDTRVKIRNWISQEPLRPNPSQAQDAVRKAIATSQPNAPGAVPEDKIVKSIFSDPGLFLVESKSARAKPAVQPPPAVANEPPQATSAALVPERRSQPRRRVLSLEYLDLGDSNGGIILNLGEDGMYIQAVASLSPDHISNLSFKIPESGYQVETSANIVWVGESRKDAGIQFDNLPEEARLKIREWVAEEFPVRQNSGQPQEPSDPAPFAAKPVPDAHKHDRLVEMPPSVVLKSLPQSSSSPATRISDQKAGSVSKIPAAEVAPVSIQSSTDISVGRGSPKQPESAAKLPLVNVPPRVVQNPADAPANNISPKQPVSSGKTSNDGANGTHTLVQRPAEAPSDASTVQKPSPVALPSTDVARPGADEKQIIAPAASSGTQIQNSFSVKSVAPNASPNSGAVNVPARQYDRKDGTRETSAATSDLADWPIAESPAVNLTPDRISSRKDIASRAAQAEQPVEIASQATPLAVPPESSESTRSLNWKSLAAAILFVVLLSFAAGWIAAGPTGRKQILDKFVSQQSDSSQPPENPGATSAQTDAPVSGAGLPQTNVATAAPEQSTNPTAAKLASQTPPIVSTQPPSQIPHSNTVSPQPASQTSPPAVASTGNVAPIAPEKSAGPNRDAATSSSTKPSFVANNTAPTNAAPRESRTPQPNSSPASNSLSASNASQPQPAQPNAAAISTSSNPSSSVAKTAPPPVSANASSPAPTAAVPDVVKATVSVNASPFPSIRVPPELKSQISKQGASLQIGQLISRVEPTYPEDAQHQRIEGVVKLRAIIARDGNIQDIDQMSGPPLLVASAANAVRQWHYKPTSLDGQPVEATESITITFRLQSNRAN